MDVAHTGIVIQLLHVGRNTSVYLSGGKQDGPITLLEM